MKRGKAAKTQLSFPVCLRRGEAFWVRQVSVSGSHSTDMQTLARQCSQKNNVVFVECKQRKVPHE